jgi:RNA polymerase sigma-70 factor (ECF subfamily)
LLANACRHALFVPVEANGSAAFGVYKPTSDGGFEASSVQVLELSPSGISAVHTLLDPSLFDLFDLPSTL